MKPASERDSAQRRSKWTNAQVERLMHLAELHRLDWERVSAALRVKTPRQCRQKYLSQTSNLKRGRWAPAEDRLVREWVARRGARAWSLCALRLRNRDGKQCRERWTNVLDPRVVKGKWSRAEQGAAFEGLRRHGNRWKAISARLPGRTPNAVKNFVNSSFRSLGASEAAKRVRALLVFPSQWRRRAGPPARDWRRKKLSQAHREIQRHLPKIEASFRGLNLLSLLALRFLLELRPPATPFSARLLRRIYGKNAAAQCQKLGIRDSGSAVKQRLLEVAAAAIAESPPGPKAGRLHLDRGHSGAPNALPLSETKRASEGSAKPARPRPESATKGRFGAAPAPRLRRCGRAPARGPPGGAGYLPVEPKYARHWAWLFEHRAALREEFCSFDKLLREAHSLSSSAEPEALETRSALP